MNDRLNYIPPTNREPFFLHKWGLVFSSIIFIIITLLRQPSALFNPQFTLEDGRVFFKDAYDNFNSLRIWFQPPPFIAGDSPFIELSARIGVSIAYLFNILYVPFVIKILASIFKILPAIFFLSKRCSNIMQNPFHRLLACIIFLLLPNQWFIEILLLNSRWFMGILAFLILVSNPSKSIYTQISDYILLTIACLSGVFVIFIFPITIIYFFIKKELLKKYTSKIIILIIIFICFCIQFFYYIHYPIIRDEHLHLGASISRFFMIFGGDFILSGLIGEKVGLEAITLPWWNYSIFFPILFSAIGICIISLAFFKINIEGKLFFMLSLLILFAELKNPLTSKGTPFTNSWEIINRVNVSDRYYFYPTMIWILSIFIVWFHYKRKIILKVITSLFILCFLFIGIIRDFLFAKYPDEHTKEILEKFNNAPKGTEITLPGSGSIDFNFTLKKH